MSLGPLQVLIVNFDEANFAGQIQAEVSRLEEAGVLRARKVLVVAKTEAGDIEVMRTMGERESGANLSDDEQAVAEALVPGSAAAIAVLEHTWALELGAAIVSAGGTSVQSQWVNAEGLAELGIELTS
jgi:hypothetical protein